MCNHSVDTTVGVMYRHFTIGTPGLIRRRNLFFLKWQGTTAQSWRFLTKVRVQRLIRRNPMTSEMTMTHYSAARHDAEKAVREVADDVSATASHMATMAGEKVDQALTHAERTARKVAEQAGEATERVQEVAGNVKSAIDKSLADQPMTTLALAAAVGFVLGALWKA